MGDPWTWRVEFADGHALDEVDESAPDGRGWASVEAYIAEHETRIQRIVLIPQRPHLSTHAVVPVNGTHVSIWRRRTLSVSPVTGQESGERPEPITFVAVKWPDGRAAYTFLFADGSVVVSDELNAV